MTSSARKKLPHDLAECGHGTPNRATVPHWSSHQLRHLAAQLAEREISVEGARNYVGHKTIALATHYSGIDLQAAAEVARRIG